MPIKPAEQTDPIDDDIPEMDLSAARPAAHFQRTARRQLEEIERLALDLKINPLGPKTTEPAQRLEREIYALRHAARSAIEALDEMLQKR